jgi:hypothetical protein
MPLATMSPVRVHPIKNQFFVLFSDGWLDLISQGSIGKVVNRD